MNSDALVKSLVERVLVEEAPEELFVLESYKPKKRRDGITARGPQGIGVTVEEAMLLVSIYPFFHRLIGKFVDNAADDLYAYFKAKFSREVSDSDEAEARRRFQAELLEAGFTEEEATRVLNAAIDSTKQHWSKIRELVEPESAG